jgi:hypothetical protein
MENFDKCANFQSDSRSQYDPCFYRGYRLQPHNALDFHLCTAFFAREFMIYFPLGCSGNFFTSGADEEKDLSTCENDGKNFGI